MRRSRSPRAAAQRAMAPGMRRAEDAQPTLQRARAVLAARFMPLSACAARLLSAVSILELLDQRSPYLLAYDAVEVLAYARAAFRDGSRPISDALGRFPSTARTSSWHRRWPARAHSCAATLASGIAVPRDLAAPQHALRADRRSLPRRALASNRTRCHRGSEACFRYPSDPAAARFAKAAPPVRH